MDEKPEMTSAALVELLQMFEGASIPVWLDGGWGVDALLQKQTRLHKDVDIVLKVSDVRKLQALLATSGFTVSEGEPPDSFVLANGAGLEVDVHAVNFDDDGNGLYRMENGEIWIYPSEGFTGRGVVGDMQVQCLSPDVQVLCHAHGYEPTEKDRRDMALLEEKFGVELPPQLIRRPPLPEGEALWKPVLDMGGKQCWIITIDKQHDLILPFKAEPYPCLIYASRETTIEEKTAIVQWLLSSNCRFTASAGMECMLWHDIVDEEYIASDPYYDTPDEQFVMTTWHTKDTIDEIAFFFVMCSNFDDHDFKKFLVLMIGRDIEAQREIEDRIRHYLEES